MSKPRHAFQEADPITWLQIHNLLPILTAIISVVVGFYILQSRVDVLTVKIAYNEAQIQELRTMCAQVKGVSTERQVK